MTPSRTLYPEHPQEQRARVVLCAAEKQAYAQFGFGVHEQAAPCEMPNQNGGPS